MNMQTIEPQSPDQGNLTDPEQTPTDHIALEVLTVPNGHEAALNVQNHNLASVSS